MPVTTIRGGRQITDGTIPYADIQSVTANTVLANNTASATAIQEVALSASNLLGRGTTGNIAAITVSNGIEFTGAVLQTTANLRSLNGLSFSSASFVKMTGANTFTLDTNTYYLASNPSGYTSNIGTVTSVGGTGTVSGLTLSGTVTTSGNLTLGGTLSASIDNITDEHRLFNNMGDNHGTRTSFDATTPSYNFGWRYVQGSTNGPGVNSATQYYHLYVGLGNDYLATGAGSYGMQIAIPRNVTTPYIAIRYNENNSLASWQKISAGYADTSGNSATTSQTNFSSLSIGGVAVATQGWVQSQGYITSYTETDTLASVTGRGATTSTAVTFNGGLSSTTGSFSSNVTWSGSSSGNPRAIAIGYSGGNYGQIGYGIAFTGTSGAHNYAINDFVTRMDFYDGIQVYGAAAGSVGAPITWTAVLDARRGGTFTYQGNNVWHAGNFTPGNYLPLSGGTITGLVTFPSSVASRPQMPGGILGLNTGDGNVDIWGISTDYYPSHGTAANAWGIQWNGDNNQVRFIGAGTQRLVIDLDGGSTGALTWEGNNIWHAGNLTNLNQLTNGPGYITSSGSITGSAGSVANTFIIRADSGTTEGTDIFTYNGSAAKSVNIAAGSNISITKVSGTWTIAASQPTVNNGTLTLAVSGNGLSGSQTFSANQSSSVTFTVTSNATTAATANTIAYRDANGDLSTRYFFGSYINTTDNDEAGITRFVIKNGDNYHRSVTTTTAADVIRGVASGSWGISISGNAATATSATSATYLNSSNYIQQRGSQGSWNADFTSTPVGTMSYGGDLGANTTNGPGGSWWMQQNFRHTNGSNSWGTQVAWGWEDNADKLAVRGISGGTFGAWVYYLNSANYNSYSPTLTGGGASGTWSINVTGSAGSVAWGNVTSKPNEIFNYDGWVSNPGYDANTIAGNKSGFTYANNAPWNGPMAHFAASGYGLQLNATYSGGGNISYRTRNGDSSTWNSWYQFIHSGNIGSQSVTYANSSGGITNQKYNISDTWFRDLSDNEQVQFYGNSRTMIYRTDGNTNDHGGGAYAHIFYYGGSADGNRVLIINTDGRLYSPYHGWLDTMSITGNAATVTNGMYLSGNQEISGVKTFYTPSGQTYNAASGNIGLTVFNPAAGDAMISFHIANDYAGYFGLGGSENDLVWTGWSVGNVRHRIWHSGNDGSGSTLDADTLDTYHASNFAFSSGSNASGTGWNISILGSAGSVASSATFNNGGSGASSGTTYNGSSAVTVSWNTVGALPTPRTTTLSDNGGTYSSLDVSTTDIFVINSLTAAATFNAPTGSPYNGQKIIFRIKDNGTAKTLTFTPGSNGAFRASSDLSLPITTIAGKTLYVGFIYNSIGAGTAGTPQPRWDLLAKLDNF